MSNESPTNSPVPLILMIIGLLAIVIFTGLGLLYVFRSDLAITATICTLTFVILGAIVFWLKTFKEKKRKEPYYVPEYILGGFYGLVALLLFPIIFHYIYIDFFKKNELKAEGLVKLESIEQIKIDYQKEVNAKKEALETNVIEAYDKLLFNAGDREARERYKDALEDLLGKNTIAFEEFSPITRKSNQEALQDQIMDMTEGMQERMERKFNTFEFDEIDNYVAGVKPIFDHWDRFNVSFYYYDMERYYNKIKNLAQTRIRELDIPPYESNKVKLDDFGHSLASTGFVPIGSVFLFLTLLHCCILLPYFTAKRPAGPPLTGRRVSEKDKEDYGSISIDKIK